MAQLSIDQVVNNFQNEIGRLTGQLLINQMQMQADQQEFLTALSAKDDEIRQLKARLDEHSIDHADITAQDPITSLDQATAVAQRLQVQPPVEGQEDEQLGEQDEDPERPVPPAAKKTAKARKKAQGRRG